MPFPRNLKGYVEEQVSDRDFVKNFEIDLAKETDLRKLNDLKRKLWGEVGKYSEYKNRDGQMKARKARHWANEVNKRIKAVKEANKNENNKNP